MLFRPITKRLVTKLGYVPEVSSLLMLNQLQLWMGWGNVLVHFVKKKLFLCLKMKSTSKSIVDSLF